MPLEAIICLAGRQSLGYQAWLGPQARCFVGEGAAWRIPPVALAAEPSPAFVDQMLIS